MTMPTFQHITPPLRLFQGNGSFALIERELARLDCRRAVLVCGASLQRQTGLLDLVRAGMGERCAGVFAGVRAHSPVASVLQARDELRRLNADAVIAVGGGSAIVTARAASILLAEEGDVRMLCTTHDSDGKLHSPKLMAPKLPQFVVPTTPTTAIVKVGSAVFDPDSGMRLALFDPKTRAQAVFIHPDLLLSSPPELLASASLNAFAMAIEGLMSRSGDALSDALLMHALRLLAQDLPDHARYGDSRVRSELLLAAIMCGQGTDYTGAGITTVLGHAIGARYELENGVLNAIVLPHVLRFNADAAPAGIDKVASALQCGPAGAGAQVERILTVLADVFTRLAIPQRLRDVGVPRDALPGIARHAIGDWFLKGNPRPVQTADELHEILVAAW
jgi:alcohol dehydrogenase class IV